MLLPVAAVIGLVAHSAIVYFVLSHAAWSASVVAGASILFVIKHLWYLHPPSTEESHMATISRDHDNGSPPGTPRWVKVFGIVVLVLVLLVVVMMATGVGGKHGPGRHMPAAGQRP